MVKAINHGVASTLATVGQETGKGIIGGVLGMAAIGALAGVGIVALGAALLPIVTFSWAVAGYVALGTGLLSGIFGVATGATIGGIVGAFNGVSKVSHEKSAFKIRMNGHEQIADIKTQAVAQQAYAAGVQDGQAHLIQEIQAAQAAQQANFAQREDARRAAATAASPGKAV